MTPKKGQAIGQVFVYIIVALTFALITIFGYKAVEGFLEKSERVALVSFKTDLETAFTQILPEYGSVRLLEFRAPIDFRKICFVNVEENAPDPCGFDAIACDQWREISPSPSGDDLRKKERYKAASQNVFISPPAEFPIKVSRLQIDDPHYLCLPVVNGRFDLRLESKGSYIIVR